MGGYLPYPAAVIENEITDQHWSLPYTRPALSSHSLGGPWFSEQQPPPPTLELLWEGPTLGGCGWSRERERDREVR